MIKRLLVVSLGLLAVTPSVFAQGNKLGIEYGIFFPSDSQLRTALGDQWVSFGIARVGAPEMSGRGRNQLRPNLNFINKDANGSKVFIASYTLGIVQPLGGGGGTARMGSYGGPSGGLYFAVRGGLAYQDYAVNLPGGRVSGKKVGFNGNVELGYALGNNLNLSARYDLFSEADGLRFNGFSVSLAYGLFKF